MNPRQCVCVRYSTHSLIKEKERFKTKAHSFHSFFKHIYARNIQNVCEKC